MRYKRRTREEKEDGQREIKDREISYGREDKKRGGRSKNIKKSKKERKQWKKE